MKKFSKFINLKNKKYYIIINKYIKIFIESFEIKKRLDVTDTIKCKQ